MTTETQAPVAAAPLLTDELPKTENMSDQELVTYFIQVDEARADAARTVEAAKLHRQRYWDELRSRHELGKKLLGLNGEARFLVQARRGDTKWKNVVFRALAFVLRTKTRTRESLVREVAKIVEEETGVSTWGELKQNLPKTSPPTTPQQREADILALLSQSESQEA